MTEHLPASQVSFDENALIAERRAKLLALRAQGVAYPNDVKREHYAADVQAAFANVETWTAENPGGVKPSCTYGWPIDG